MVTPARTFAAVFGAAYVVVGIAGFVVTGVDGFAATGSGDRLLGLELNPLHNVVHLLVGAALLAGVAAGEAPARSLVLGVAAAYGVVGVLGLAVVDDPVLDLLSLNTADNVLHMITAALAFVAAAVSPAGPDRRPRGPSPPN